MKLLKTPIEGMLEIDFDPWSDERGVFVEAFVRDKLEALGLSFDVRRIHISRSKAAGTVRGLHWQAAPWEQGKIVLSAAGRIFDAAVDVRKKSKTFGTSYTLVLSPQANALFIPRGVAHGCQALEDDATLLYLVDNDYKPSHERGIRPDDPAIKIHWPLPPVHVAKRDASWPTLSEIMES